MAREFEMAKITSKREGIYYKKKILYSITNIKVKIEDFSVIF